MKPERIDDSTLKRERMDCPDGGGDQVTVVGKSTSDIEAMEIIREFKAGLSIMGLECLKWEGLNC